MVRSTQSSSSSDEERGNVNGNSVGNQPSTPNSPTSAGFNTDQLPFNSTSEAYSEEEEIEEAAVDPRIIRDDEPEDEEDEEEGEDLFNDNYMESVFFSLFFTHHISFSLYYYLLLIINY